MLRKVSDLFPVTYGKKAPLGFGGKPDETQRLFNRVTHLAMWPHDASYDEIDAGMVINIPDWAHWLVSGRLPASLSDEAVCRTLALYKAVLDAVGRAIGVDGFGRRDFLARRLLGNEQVFEEWLADFARREGMSLESARAHVLEARATAASSARSAAGRMEHEATRRAEIVDFDLSGYDFDPVCHDRKVSYQWTREEIERKKVDAEKARQEAPGLTIRDMNELGISYKDLKSTQSYGVDENAEVVVTATKTGRILSRTGKFVARILENMAGKADEAAVEPDSAQDDAPEASDGILSMLADVPRLATAPMQLFLCL